MDIGMTVVCTEYIRKTRNRFEIDDGNCTGIIGATGERIEVEDVLSLPKFQTIRKLFTGVYVGTTTLCTEINVDCADSYGRGPRYWCDAPQEFAVVYYANNRKRLVPVGSVAPFGVKED